MLYLHGNKKLRSCRDSQLPNHTVPPKGSLPVSSQHSFATELALFESAEKNFFIKDCAGSEGQSQDRYLQSIHAIDRATTPGF